MDWALGKGVGEGTVAALALAAFREMLWTQNSLAIRKCVWLRGIPLDGRVPLFVNGDKFYIMPTAQTTNVPKMGIGS